MNNPEISVIVPVYNTEKYLDRCINSILGQTFKNYEIILVDDGSSDHCPEKCDEWSYHDTRVKVIHKKNGGASSARNVGLKKVMGDFITFVDSDDWIEPQMFEKLLSLIQQYDADMCLTDFRVNNGSKKIRQKGHPKVEVWGRKECMDRFFRIKGEDSHYYTHSCLFRKDFLQGFSFIEGRMNEDVIANYWFATHCKKAIHTDEPFYNYFINSQGVTRKFFTTHKLDLLYIWELIAEQVVKESPEYIYACKMNQKRAEFTLLSLMFFNGYNHQDPELCDIKKNLKVHVRLNYRELMCWKMPLSRKILMTFLIL